MKPKLYLLVFILTSLTFLACAPEEIEGDPVEDNNTICNSNGVCDEGETEQNCSSDCTPPICDNDGVCDSGETEQNCPADCTPPNHKTGTLSYAGLNYLFDYTAQSFHLQNTNPYVVRLCGSFYCNKILEPNQGETVRAGFSTGQQIEIQVWKGAAATWYTILHGNTADQIGHAVLSEGAMSATDNYSDLISYLALLSPGNSVDCELSGRYTKADPKVQVRNTLYCCNNGSDSVKVEYFHLKPVSGNKYQSDGKMMAPFWAITPDSEDINAISASYAINDTVAIRVISGNKVAISGYFIDVTLNKAIKMADTIVIEILD